MVYLNYDDLCCVGVVAFVVELRRCVREAHALYPQTLADQVTSLCYVFGLAILNASGMFVADSGRAEAYVWEQSSMVPQHVFGLNHPRPWDAED